MKGKKIIAVGMASLTLANSVTALSNAIDQTESNTLESTSEKAKLSSDDPYSEENLTRIVTKNVIIPEFPKGGIEKNSSANEFLNPTPGKWFKFSDAYYLRYENGFNWYDTNKWYRHPDTVRPRGGHDSVSC